MQVSRRSVLLGGAVATAAVGTELLLPLPAGAASKRAAPPPAPPTNPALTGTASPNGWPVNTGSDAGGTVWTRPVPGTGFNVQVSIGDAEVILVHVIRRFHYEIDTLRPGDVVGFRAAGGLSGHLLNHASGTAIDIRPGHYPAGAHGGLFPHELAVVRDILAECDGVVRWGGDFGTPDEAHFQVDAPPADPRVAALVTKLRAWNTTPGRGAGAVPDPRDPARRAAAQRLAERQGG